MLKTIFAYKFSTNLSKKNFQRKLKGFNED